MKNKKIVIFIAIILIICIFVAIFVNKNDEKSKNIQDKIMISKEDAINLLKEQYPNKNIYNYIEKDDKYHIIKVVNDPTIEYLVDIYTGEIMIQTTFSGTTGEIKSKS